MLQRLTGVGVAAILLGMLSLSGRAWAASLDTVVPNMSDINGGEVVEITGTGVDWSNATDVTFGGTSGSGFAIVSATKLQITTPAHAKGKVIVAVVDPDAADQVTLADGLTFTTHNRVLQVSVHMTIAQQVKIAWGDATSNNDTAATALAGAAVAAGDITPYTWYVRDPEFGSPAQINLGATYSTDGAGTTFTADTDNARTLNVINISQTSSPVDIAAVCSHSVPDQATSPSWAPAAGPGTDAFQMRANMAVAGGATPGVSSGSQTLNDGNTAAAVQLYNELVATTTALSNSSRLHLEVQTPTATTITATTEHVVTVSLIGTAD